MTPPFPHSPAAERNAAPIADALARVLLAGDVVLEIGSGTGQHAIHFAKCFPNVVWKPSEIPENVRALRARLHHERIDTIMEAEVLDVLRGPWPAWSPTVIFTANTFHIMPEAGWKCVVDEAGARLASGGRLVVYGPMRYRDQPLELSNARFEQMLQQAEPTRGIRVFEDIVERAASVGLVLIEDVAMPASNRTLIFRRDA